MIIVVRRNLSVSPDTFIISGIAEPTATLSQVLYYVIICPPRRVFNLFRGHQGALVVNIVRQ